MGYLVSILYACANRGYIIATTTAKTTTIGTPPAPIATPVNIFKNVDPRLCFILSNVYPSYSQPQIATLASNRTLWGPILDSYSQWTTNCVVSIEYFKYLEDLIVLRNDNNTWVTFNRLKQVLLCKRDCNFVRLLSINNTLFTKNITDFAQKMASYLTPDVGKMCRKAFPSLEVKNISASDLVNNLGQISI